MFLILIGNWSKILAFPVLTNKRSSHQLSQTSGCIDNGEKKILLEIDSKHPGVFAVDSIFITDGL